jgi:hypothetical protein
MVCILRKHSFRIIKIIFYTDTLLVSCAHDKSIIFWEINKQKLINGKSIYKAKDFRIITGTQYFLDIAMTHNRFICRKGPPNAEIKIIKFSDFKKDLKAELFTEDYLKKQKA